MGLEPTRPCGHRILNPERLPIPPLGLSVVFVFSAISQQKFKPAKNFLALKFSPSKRLKIIRISHPLGRPAELIFVRSRGWCLLKRAVRVLLLVKRDCSSLGTWKE